MDKFIITNPLKKHCKHLSVQQSWKSISDSNLKDEIAEDLNYVKSNEKFEINIINTENKEIDSVTVTETSNFSQFNH